MRDHPVSTVMAVVGTILVIGVAILGLTGGLNRFFFQVQKIDDATNYNTIKKVEDSCRAMISSYTADKLTWQQYKDAENAEQRSWADQAKMRANKTAANYNEYILKNSFVWEGNVPNDIKQQLEYLN